MSVHIPLIEILFDRFRGASAFFRISERGVVNSAGMSRTKRSPHAGNPAPAGPPRQPTLRPLLTNPFLLSHTSKKVLLLRRRFAYLSSMRCSNFIVAGLLLGNLALAADAPWRPLFNGRDLSGWDTEMMNIPDKAWDVPGLKRDTNGVYLEALGKNRDPLHVFTVTNMDGVPTIHVSGQGFGVMMTTETFTNIHLRLQIKWGERKWSKKMNMPFDTGLLYFCHSEAGLADKTWPRCFEFQICENEFGDLYSLASQITVPARQGWKSVALRPRRHATLFLQQRPVGNHCAHHRGRRETQGRMEHARPDHLQWRQHPCRQRPSRHAPAQRPAAGRPRARADHVRENQFADRRRRNVSSVTWNSSPLRKSRLNLPNRTSEGHPLQGGLRPEANSVRPPCLPLPATKNAKNRKKRLDATTLCCYEQSKHIT